MSLQIVLQGLTKNSHFDAVERVMSLPDLKVALVSVAFARSSGVGHLVGFVGPNAKRTTVYVGIRNAITSAQALRALLDGGVTVYTVDTGSVKKIFHPKLYFARSDKAARLLVGSANLTSGGLIGNIETSIALDLDLTNADHKALCQSIEDTFGGLNASHPENVSKVSASKSLEDLLLDVRLSDEFIAPRPVGVVGQSKEPSPVPLMVTHLKKVTSAAKKAVAPSQKKAPVAPAPVTIVPVVGQAIQYRRVWKTDGLKQRDLNVPKGLNTHATGSMNLDKGDLLGDYEWASFFRQKVFEKLVWSRLDARRNQKATGSFRLIVEGIDCGEFELEVKHDTKIDTASYAQGNAMTKLSWGSAKPFVARPALVGRSLTLSKAIGVDGRFLIEID